MTTMISFKLRIMTATTSAFLLSLSLVWTGCICLDSNASDKARTGIVRRQASTENPFSASVSIPVERNVESIGAALSERDRSWLNVCNSGGKRRLWRGGRRPPLRRPVETVVAPSSATFRKKRSLNEPDDSKLSTKSKLASQSSKLMMLIDSRQQLADNKHQKHLYSQTETAKKELAQGQSATVDNKTLGEFMFGHFALAQWNILGGIDRTTRLKVLTEEILQREQANLLASSNNSGGGLPLQNGSNINTKAQVDWFPTFESLLVTTSYDDGLNSSTHRVDSSSLLKNISDYAQYFALAIEQTLIDHQIERETLALKYQSLETQNKELLCDLSKITNVLDESTRDSQRFGNLDLPVTGQQDGALAKSVQLMKELTISRCKQVLMSPIVKLAKPPTLERETMPMDQRLIDSSSERAKRDLIIMENYSRFLGFYNDLLRELSKVS